MTDVDRGTLGGADEDRLPWLEAVEDEQDEGGVSTGKLIGAVIVALIAIGLVVGGIFWMRDRGAGDRSGDGELIAAPAGDYKEKPTEPGGMKIEGQGDAAYAASEGDDVNTALDLSALPETPMAGAGSAAGGEVKTVQVPGSAAKAAPAPKPAEKVVAVQQAAPVAKPEPKPAEASAAAPVVGGGTIQLGAFSSEAKANAAWTSLSGRFGFLAPLSKAVIPVTTGNGTLYRLRASGAGSGGVCQKLKVAGESCTVIG